VNLNNLGTLKQGRGNVDEAEALFARALSIKEKLLEPDHPDLAITLNNLAILCRGQGRLEEAERLYERCLSIFKNALRPGHPN
jgi:tetratricopeptide (TPR) repeat protein